MGLLCTRQVVRKQAFVRESMLRFKIRGSSIVKTPAFWSDSCYYELRKGKRPYEGDIAETYISRYYIRLLLVSNFSIFRKDCSRSFGFNVLYLVHTRETFKQFKAKIMSDIHSGTPVLQ